MTLGYGSNRRGGPALLGGSRMGRRVFLSLSVLAGFPTSSWAGPLDPKVPLDPGNGGRTILGSELRPGDIVVSTTKAEISRAIRKITQAEVSHALVYVGDGQVFEATGEGVGPRSIDAITKSARLAVAFRHPKLDPAQMKQMRKYLEQQIGKKYNVWGIVSHPRFGILNCDGVAEPQRIDCRTLKWLVRVTVGTEGDRLFCSQLVYEAFRQVGLALAPADPAASAPKDIVEASWTDLLNYVGHLAYPTR